MQAACQLLPAQGPARLARRAAAARQRSARRSLSSSSEIIAPCARLDTPGHRWSLASRLPSGRRMQTAILAGPVCEAGCGAPTTSDQALRTPTIGVIFVGGIYAVRMQLDELEPVTLAAVGDGSKP